MNDEKYSQTGITVIIHANHESQSDHHHAMVHN